MISKSLTALALATASITVSAVPLSARNSGQQDPCAYLASQNSTLFQPADVQACLLSIPYNQTLAENAIQYILAMNKLNIFQYNQIHSDSVLNQAVNLEETLYEIGNTTYGSDYEFQRAIYDLYAALNDGHFTWSNCYHNDFFTFHVLPIELLASSPTSDDGEVYIIPDAAVSAAGYDLGPYMARQGINVSEVAGSKVTQINGTSAIDYVYKRANTAGVYQDYQQRLNSIYASYSLVGGAWARAQGVFTQLDGPDATHLNMTIELADGSTQDLSVPYITTYNGQAAFNYTSGAEYFKGSCLAQTAPMISANTTESLRPSRNDRKPSAQIFAVNASAPTSVFNPEVAQAIYAGCPVSPALEARYPAPNAPSNTSYYLGGRDIQFYLLPMNETNDVQTGAIFISTFEVMPDTDNCTNRFAADTILGLANFTAAGVERVVIDTSNNGGGSIFLSEFFQRAITGETYVDNLGFDTVFRKADLAETLLSAHLRNETADPLLYGPSKFLDGNGTAFTNATANYFDPGRNYTINNNLLSTSNYVQDTTDDVEAVSMDNLNSTAPFAPGNIIFTGNGLCGSSCSIVTNWLIEYFNATGNVVSAEPSQPIEFQAFAAGQASNTQVIEEEIEEFALNATAFREPLLYNGYVAFALRAAISPNVAPGSFMQYRTFPAKSSFSMTPDFYSSPVALWIYAARTGFD